MADDTPTHDETSVGRRRFLKAGLALVALPPALEACADDPPGPGLTGDDADVGSDLSSGDTTAPDSVGPGDAVADSDTGPISDGAQPVDFEPEAVSADDVVFDRGVSAGAVRDTSAIVWGYAAAPSDPVRLKLWREAPDAGQVLMVTDAEVQPTEGYIKLTQDGLVPGTRYHYGFFSQSGDAASGRSSIGTFKTAPVEGDAPVLTIGATACTNWGFMPYVALERTAEEDVDLFLHLGDMAYNDGAASLANFRDNWRATLQDPGYRAVLSSAGSLFTWDDHEVSNNDGRFTLPSETVANARSSFFETLPVPDNEPFKLWTSYRWGSTAEIFVMDCRSERQLATRTSDDPIYIGKEQMAWLKDGLVNSPCHFKILMNSVPMTQLPSIAPLAEDRWDGYAAQRAELLDHIVDEDVRNVWVISGDFHVGAVGRVMPDGPASRIREILVGPGGNSADGIIGALGPDLIKQAFPAGQLQYFAGTVATSILTFDPTADTVRVQFIDPTTDTADFDATINEND